MAVKRVVLFVFMFLMGIGNFAHAYSPMAACVAMPVMNMSQVCCGPEACECRMEAGRSELLFAQVSSEQGVSFESLVTDGTNAKSVESVSDQFDSPSSASESPPKDKVYDLYSQYRI